MHSEGETRPIEISGTCHLHGDSTCGKILRIGRDAKLHAGRVRCVQCNTVFCRNGLKKKFDITVGDGANWKCVLCLGVCCCRGGTACEEAQANPSLKHTHCHNYRSMMGQRVKRKRQKEMQNETNESNTQKAMSLKAFKTVYQLLHEKQLNMVISETAYLAREVKIQQALGVLARDKIVLAIAAFIVRSVQKDNTVQVDVGDAAPRGNATTEMMQAVSNTTANKVSGRPCRIQDLLS